MRQPRTVGGGVATNNGGIVTRGIVALTVAFFVLQILTPAITRALALVDFAVAAGEWWRLVTVVLVHASVLHVAFNMYALWLVGQQIEIWLGRTRFIALYLVSALAGSALSYMFGQGYSVGASGAIFGVFGALAVLSRRLGYDMRPAVALIAINLVLSFTIPGIDWHAHVGGLVAGTLLTIAFAYSPPRLRTVGAVATSVVLVAVCLGMVVVHTQTIKDDPRQEPCVEQVHACLKQLDTNVLGL